MAQVARARKTLSVCQRQIRQANSQPDRLANSGTAQAEYGKIRN
jgi:hypothetical protein